MSEKLMAPGIVVERLEDVTTVRQFFVSDEQIERLALERGEPIEDELDRHTLAERLVADFFVTEQSPEDSMRFGVVKIDQSERSIDGTTEFSVLGRKEEPLLVSDALRVRLLQDCAEEMFGRLQAVADGHGISEAKRFVARVEAEIASQGERLRKVKDGVNEAAQTPRGG